MNANMAKNLSNVTGVMGKVNAQMNPQEMVNTMKEFSKEMEKMGMQQDMMGDAMDMAGDADTDNQAEEVYSQILGEIGMGVNADIKAGDTAIAAPTAAVGTADQNDDLQARLDALKGT